ncbi:hypothetical protein [Hoylesella timonensis]|nr:hypothetical protein [Hoylesella timonensis]
MATAHSPEYPTPVDVASKYGLKGQQAYSPWQRTTVDAESKDGLKAQ